LIREIREIRGLNFNQAVIVVSNRFFISSFRRLARSRLIFFETSLLSSVIANRLDI